MNDIEDIDNSTQEAISDDASGVSDLNDNTPCTQSTERCRYDRHDKNKISPACCHDHLKEMLFFFDDLAKKLDMKYFLDFGTLLGCVRDGKIIPYDTDIDISMLFEDHDKLEQMRPHFKQRGYVLKKERDSGVFYRLFYSDINLLHIDIHLRKTDENGLVHSHYSAKNWSLHKNDLFPMYQMMFEGRLMHIPRHFRKYLEHGYGFGCIENPKRKNEYKQKF
jgi:phosphorylcholine metabolism protein LicD